jgi:hypothetical protein
MHQNFKPQKAKEFYYYELNEAHHFEAPASSYIMSLHLLQHRSNIKNLIV